MSLADPRKTVVSTLLESRSPVLLVQSSDGAEALARKNGLTVADLLRPFAEIKEGASFRTSSSIMSLRGQRLRVIPAAEFGNPAWDESEAALARAVAAEALAVGISVPGVPAPVGKSSLPEIMLSSAEDASRSLSKLKTADPAPWIAGFRRTLAHALRCLPIEQFESPAAILVVVSTSDPDPVKCVSDFLSPGSLPRPYSLDQYEPSFEAAPRIVILLSDKAAEKEPAGLTGMNATAAVAAQLVTASAVAAGVLDQQSGVSYSHPLSGRKPVDPMAVIREVKQRFAGINVVGAFVNSHAAADVMAGTAPAPADIWGSSMLEPMIQRPTDLPVLSAISGQPLQSPSGSANVDVTAGAHQQQSAMPVVDTLLRCALVPKRGCCLAETDVNGLRSMVRSFIDGSVVPALEQRLAALSNVGKQKTGLRGVLKSFIGTASNLEIGSGTTAGRRSGGLVTSAGPVSATSLLSSGSASTAISGPVSGVPSSSLSGSSTGFDEGNAPGLGSVVSHDVLTVCYPYAVQYAQTRLLADLQLFVGDTDGAATSFKILRDESKNDKTPAHYGAACEGLALSYLLRDCREGSRDPPSVPSREAEGYLEQAANAYYRAAQASAGLMPPPAASGPAQAVGAGATGVLAHGWHLASNSEPMAPAVTAALARRLALRLATRASLALAELQIGSSVHTIQSAGAAGAQGGAAQGAGVRLREAASFLRRVAQAEGDGSLAAAIMTEQAGYACLRVSPPSHRRAAYHFSTAGMLYGAAGSAFAGLAVRCLLAAITAVGENPAAQLKPVAGDPDALSESSPWALISDHLCLHAAQRLLQLGNAEGAANTLCAALTTSAARLSPVVQKNMLKELVKAQVLAQHAKKAGNVKAAVERWLKKEKATLPEAAARGLAIFDTTATAGTPVSTAEDKEYTSAYVALEAALPAAVWEGIIADAEKASEYVSPGLPLVQNSTLQVVSWSNALAAAAGIREICSAGALGLVAPTDAPGSAALLSAAITSAAYPLWSTDASRLSAASTALQELGTGEGSVPGDGLWAGHLPGEGPVRPGETASGPGRNAWVRMQEGFVRDVKARDKAGGGDIFRTNGSFGATSSGSEGPQAVVDWRKTCQDVAIAAEDEAEMAAKAHKSSAEGHGWGEASMGGSMTAEGAAAVAGAHTDPLAATSAVALAPYVLAGPDGAVPPEYNVRRGSKAGLQSRVGALWDGEHGATAADGEVSLDDVALDAVAFPSGPAAAALAAAAAAGSVRTAPPLSSSSGSSNSGSFRGLIPGGLTSTPPGSARNLLAAQQQARPSGASAAASSSNQNQLSHASEFLSKSQERYVGEPLAVVVTVHNPTSVELHMTSLRLVGEVKDAKPEGAVTLQDIHAGSGSGWAVTCSGSNLAVMSLNVTIGPGESKTLYLPATPLAQGTMIIKGMAWRLSSTPVLAGPPGAHVGARYRHDFELKGPPLNDSKASKASGARAVDRRLEAKVKPAREWAGVSISGLDASWSVNGQAGAGSLGDTISLLAPIPVAVSTSAEGTAAGPPIPAGPPLPVHLPIAKTLHMWEGEVRSVRFSFRNAGSLPICSVWIRTTGAGRVVLGSAGEEGTLDGLEGATLPMDLTKATVTGGTLVQVQGAGAATPATPGTPALLAAEAGMAGSQGADKVTALPTGATATWTISMRAAVAGSHALRMLVLYSAQPAAAITSRSIASGALRALRWVTRVHVLPCLSALVTCKPSSEEAGQYDLCLSVVNMSPPSAGALVPTAGAGVAGAAPVTLPIDIPEVRIISDHWHASLVDVGSTSLVPTTTTTPVTGMGGLPEGSKPLAYLWCRTYKYRLTSKAAQPTMLVSQMCEPVLLPMEQKGPAAGSVRGLQGLQASLLTLLRAGHGQQIVQGLISVARKAEHARRRAAEAADALPPTLRSIRMGKAGAEGEDGLGTEEVVDPLPSSTHALTRTLGLGGIPAGNTVGLLISWTKPSSILSAVTKSEASLPPVLSPSGFLHVPAIILSNRESTTGAGSALRAAVLQLAALAAVQAAERAAAADAAHTGGTPVATASVPVPVRSLAPPPFGASQGAGSAPIQGMGPFDKPAPSRTMSTHVVNGVAAAAAARAAAAATLPLAATLTLSMPPKPAEGGHSPGHALSPATALLLLYHTGGSGTHGQESLDLEVRAGSLGAQEECHPCLPSQGAIRNGALHTGVEWAGATQHVLPVLKPGCRVAVHMQVLVDSSLPVERLKAEAEAALAIRLPGKPWLPIAF